MASAGDLATGSSFLNAITVIFDYAYLSSTNITAATASLVAGNVAAADYSAATSSAAVVAAAAAIDVRRINAALYCSFLAAAVANSSEATATSLYSSLCLPAPTFSSLAGVAFLAGYLANCLVFLDLNQNELLDSGEPFGATSSSGTYTIALPQVGLCPPDPQSPFVSLF